MQHVHQSPHSPTRRAYAEFQAAYDYFNAELFGGALPPCLITMQRKARAGGYFAPERFGTRTADEITDEIAMNPEFLRRTDTRFALSVLVHEMAHLQQQHFGAPSRTGYHNKEWARMMRAVGLVPSSTGEPGGKDVGQRMAHYIEEGGRFDAACAAFLRRGGDLSYVDLWDRDKAKAKRASKTKYSCPVCSANAWAKPATRLVCGECEERMVAEDAEAAE